MNSTKQVQLKADFTKSFHSCYANVDAIWMLDG